MHLHVLVLERQSSWCSLLQSTSMLSCAKSKIRVFTVVGCRSTCTYRMLNGLLIFGIPKKLVQLINVTTAGSKATVRVDNQYTFTFPITNGVRPGDVLSFILFDLVLEAIFQRLNITGYIGTKIIQIFAYADCGSSEQK